MRQPFFGAKSFLYFTINSKRITTEPASPIASNQAQSAITTFRAKVSLLLSMVKMSTVSMIVVVNSIAVKTQNAVSTIFWFFLALTSYIVVSIWRIESLWFSTICLI